MSLSSAALLKYDKSFYATVLRIAIPIIIEHVISISLNMLDTLMIGKLGVNQLAGVGSANRVFFVFIIVCFGFYSGASVLLSQYWGVRDLPNIRRILGVDYCFGIVVSLAVMAWAYFDTPQLISFFSKDPAVIGFGATYLRIAQFSYICTAVTFAAAFNCRCIHRLAIPVLINGLALAVKTLLNYCLIYGNLGFPALGVEGAAIAVVAARLLEMSAMLFYIYHARQHPFAARLRELADWNRQLLRNVLRTTAPVVISESTWSFGNAVYYVAYGMLGPAAQAVVQVASVVSDLFQALFFGLGNASAVMIGNKLGQGDKDAAYDYSKVFLKLTLGFCLLMSLLFLAMKNPIIRLYGYDAVTSAMLHNTLLVYILYTTPRMLVYTLFIGILRAGGDTRFCMILDVLGIWCIGVPLAFLGVRLGLPLYGVVAMSLGDELVKLWICLARMKSKRWINVLI